MTEPTQDTTEPTPLEMAPENTGPTTSPDVVITEDPGPAPDSENDTQSDDGSEATPVAEDPASDEQVVEVTGGDSDNVLEEE